MGYSTTLYAVDLGALRAAVGGNDAALFARTWAAWQAHLGGLPPDPAAGPRVKILLDGGLELNGRRATLAELGATLKESRWKGTNLYLFAERGHARGPRPTAMEVAAAAGPGTVAGVLTCGTEEEFLKGWDADEMPPEQALRELLAGAFTNPDGDAQYGYALEQLCAVLGERLGVIPGKGRLAALKLDTPLTKSRPPAPLPDWDDFPYTSHLTADEARAEDARLSALDLAFPANAGVARDRLAYRDLMRAAAGRGLGVVSFYY
jgi:hypothetical protein